MLSSWEIFWGFPERHTFCKRKSHVFNLSHCSIPHLGNSVQSTYFYGFELWHSPIYPIFKLQICLATFGTLSFLLFALRSAIRLRTHHPLDLSDTLLFVGCLCFCIASGLAYSILRAVYLSEAIAIAIVQDSTASINPSDRKSVFNVVLVYDAVPFLTWTAEFAVKLSILSSFRVLVRRLPRLTTYLWVTVGFNTFVWGFLALLDFVTCPSAGRARMGEFGHTISIESFCY